MKRALWLSVPLLSASTAYATGDCLGAACGAILPGVSGGGAVVPEFDGGAAVMAIGLTAGLVALIRERAKKK